ncbi:MAG TPA: tetratricopeptide repeat protein [Gemmataceae bacterium]|jgi:tetratricopeptide (TPR) repeat protein|nr:tetratricopeptide repeat protein [Gemmataceae bacterium]
MLRLLAFFCLALPCLALADDEPKMPKAKKPEGPLAEAHQRWLRGNYEEARAQYEKLLDDEKSRAAAAIGIARTLQSTGDDAKALTAIEDALAKDAKNADLLAAHADMLFGMGRWDDAAKDADAAIKLKSDHFLARWVRARHIRDTGDVKKADAEMRWFVRTYTQRDNADKPITDPEELLLVGLAGAENARAHSLADQFRFLINDIYPDVLKFDPDDWRAEWHIGMLLLEKYNRPEAIQAFDNALKINPNAAEAHVGKGLVALQQFETKEADTHADAALKINPKLVSALRLKADGQLLAGDVNAARTLLEKAKEVSPRDEATLARLAACARVLNKPEEVKSIIAAVEKFNPKPGLFYHDLGSSLEDRKIYGDAEVYFKKSIEARDQLASSKAGLGMLYLRLGKENEAKDLLEAAFKGDTFNVRVSNSLKVLRHLEKYETIKTRHYDLRFDPKQDKLLAEFLAEYLEVVHAQLAQDFGYEPAGRTLVELFNNHEMFSGRTVGLPDLHTIGACTGKVVTIASPKGKGLTKPFNWGRVIRHELVHIFNLAQTDFLCPHWLTEGLAVRNEGGNRPPQWSAVLRDRFEQNDLLNLDNIMLAFVRPRNQEEWALAYCQSNLYVEYLIKTYGIVAVGPMLNAYRDGLDTAAAIQKVCKVDKDAFEKGYMAYVTQIVKAIPSIEKKGPGEKPMTLAELEKAHEDNPDDLDIAAKLADQYSRRKRAADARKLAEQVLKQKPGHPLASIVKARLLTQAGDEDGAKEAIESAAKANPNDPRLLAGLGRMAMEAKDWTKAAELLERGRKLAPIDGEWLALLIEIYTKVEDAEKLLDVLKEQVGNDPDDLKSRVKLSKLLCEVKKFVEAEDVARDATRIDVTDAEAQLALIEALEGQKKIKEVEELKKRFGEAKAGETKE